MMLLKVFTLFNNLLLERKIKLRTPKYKLTKEQCEEAIKLYETTRMTQAQIANHLSVATSEIVYMIKYYRIAAEIVEDKKCG